MLKYMKRDESCLKGQNTKEYATMHTMTKRMSIATMYDIIFFPSLASRCAFIAALLFFFSDFLLIIYYFKKENYRLNITNFRILK